MSAVLRAGALLGPHAYVEGEGSAVAAKKASHQWLAGGGNQEMNVENALQTIADALVLDDEYRDGSNSDELRQATAAFQKVCNYFDDKENDDEI